MYIVGRRKAVVGNDHGLASWLPAERMPPHLREFVHGVDCDIQGKWK